MLQHMTHIYAESGQCHRFKCQRFECQRCECQRFKCHIFECHMFECQICLEISRVMSRVDSSVFMFPGTHVPLFVPTWLIYCLLVSTCFWLCPCVSCCAPYVLLKQPFCFLVQSWKDISSTSTDNSSVGISLFSLWLSPLEIQVEFRSGSAVAPPKETLTDLTGFLRLVSAWHKGRRTREAAGDEKQDCL